MPIDGISADRIAGASAPRYANDWHQPGTVAETRQIKHQDDGATTRTPEFAHDSGLFTQSWLILPPWWRQTRRRPGPRIAARPVAAVPQLAAVDRSRRWLCVGRSERSVACDEARSRDVDPGPGIARGCSGHDGRSGHHAHHALPGHRGRARIQPELRRLDHDRQARPGRPVGRQGPDRLDGGHARRRVHHRRRGVARRHGRRPRSRSTSRSRPTRPPARS